MTKITSDADVCEKYNFRMQAQNIYRNDAFNNGDLNGEFFSLRDKYDSIKMIEGSAETCKFLITFNSPEDLTRDSGFILRDINNILNNYLLNEGLDTKLTCGDIILFDHSIFSSFIEVRL